MDIRIFELPPLATNAYLLTNVDTREAVLVDAPLTAAQVVDEALAESGATLKALLLTHAHWDHILDAPPLAARGLPVYGHEGDRPLFLDPEQMATYALPGIDWQPVEVTHWLEHGEELSLCGWTFTIRHAPGHSPGSILFYESSQGVCFSGDVVFSGSIGRYDFPGGDFATLEQSIREQVYTLPDNTVLHPGHGPRTTVERERRSNPFVHD